MFAVIETGGKQYIVTPDKKIKIEKIKPDGKSQVVFDKVLLLVDDKGVKMGKPYIKGAEVKAEIINEGREDKVIVFKYRAKKRYKKKAGHRQPYTEVSIGSIETSKSKPQSSNVKI